MKKMIDCWKQEAERSLEGWDFSYLLKLEI